MNKAAYERGGIAHFFEYAIAECEKGIKKYGLDKQSFDTISFTPKSNAYFLSYMPEKKGGSIAVSLVEDDGDIGEVMLALKYDGRKFSKKSLFLDISAQRIFEGKFKYPIPEEIYAHVASESVLPCLVCSGNNAYKLTDTKDVIQWNGAEHISVNMQLHSEIFKMIR